MGLLKKVYIMILTVMLSASMCMINVSASTNQTVIYNYLTKTMKLSPAASCGVLANIAVESGFNPTMKGDNGTSYGICQWHKSRFTALKDYCKSKKLDYKTLTGQLSYLNYELTNKYTKVLAYIKSVPNTGEGAYDAGYYYCYYYEVPSDKKNKSKKRGASAQEVYFPAYVKTATSKTTTTAKKPAATPKAATKTTSKYKPGTWKTTGSVVLRKKASKKSAIVSYVKKGATLKVTKNSGKWGYVNYKGHKGYVSLKFARFIK